MLLTSCSAHAAEGSTEHWLFGARVVAPAVALEGCLKRELLYLCVFPQVKTVSLRPKAVSSPDSLELRGAASPQIACASGIQLLMGRFEINLAKLCPGDRMTLQFVSAPIRKRVM